MRRWSMVLGAVAAAAVVLGVASQVVAQGGGGSKVFFAVLTGGKELETNGQRGAGDSNGRGAFSATLDGRTLCYGIQVKNISNPLQAHIHRGGAGVARGEVRQTLKQPSKGDPGASAACVRLSRSLASAIGSSPENFYVNVHTADFPNGAIRGQLFARSR